MDLDISSSNILHVNGEFLQAQHTTPEELYEILVKSRWRIEKAIEKQYQELVKRNEDIARHNEELRTHFKPLDDSDIPDLLTPLTIQRGSAWVMRLSDDEAKVITPQGLLVDSWKYEDRGVYTNWLDVRQDFWPYAEAAWRAGLRPEGRLSDKVKSMNGFCLLVRIRSSR